MFKKEKKSSESANEALFEWIIEDLQSFNVVTKPSFIKFVEVLNDSYKLPCRQTIASKILQLYDDHIQKKIKFLRSIKGKNRFCI